MTPTTRSADDRLAALFPDPDAPENVQSRRRRQQRIAISVVVLAILVVTTLATNAFGSSGSSFRFATVAQHDVDGVLTTVATIEPVSQATVAFPVAGKVASVDVALGDSVAAGQPLAALDTQNLVDTFHTKQAALAQAQLVLSEALAGKSVSSGSGGASPGGGGNGGSGATLSAARSPATTRYVLTAAPDPQLAAAQQAVVAAQQAVDAALATAQAKLSSAQTVCAGAGAGGGSPTTTTTTTPGGGGGGSGPDLTACQTALGDVLTAQNAVSAAQHTLATASSALDDLLAQRAAASTPTTPSTTAPATGRSGTGTGATGGSGSGGSGAGTGASGSSGSSGFGGTGRSSATSAPSAADLAADQKAVDAATSDVAVAFQAIAQATITSPIAGTVVSLGLTVGSSVTAASSTANVVVQGGGGFEATASIGVTQLGTVKAGDPATLLPDGSHQSLDGKVTSVSVAPTDTTTTTNYRVVVGLDTPNAKLNNGSTGTVSIVTSSAKSALAVPTSAVTTIGGRHTVTVVDGDTTQVVFVQVGVVGTEWTEITSGLKAGQQVMLADLSQPLPGSATSSNGTTTNNGAGAGGLNFPGGGNFRIRNLPNPGG